MELTPEQEACLACFEELFGCSLLDLIPGLTKDNIATALGVAPLPTATSTIYCAPTVELPLAENEALVWNGEVLDGSTPAELLDGINAAGGDSAGEDFFLNEDGNLCSNNPPGGNFCIRIFVEGGFGTRCVLWTATLTDEIDCTDALACFEALFGIGLLEIIEKIRPYTPETLDKDAIAMAVQSGLPDPGAPAETSTTGTLVGVIPWDDAGVFQPGDTIPTELGPVANPSCEEEDFGTLVIDLNLPAEVEPGTTAATTFTVIDASAGWGTTYVYDKGNNLVLGQTYPPGAGGQGNGVPVPFDHTVSYTIPAGTDPTEVCLVINAFGQGGTWEGSCDEIGPEETIVTVTPDPCAPAKACFEDIFGCPIESLIDFPPAPEIPEIPPAVEIPTLPELEVPTITTTMGGTFVETQATIILDTWEERDVFGNLMAVTFATRTRVSQVAGNNWGWINIPTVAGFKQPQISAVGNYRNQSISPQDDDGVQGASPRGPYMGKEIFHWSSTNRLYGGHFRRDNDIGSMFVQANVRYVRN